jgi:hypothetical protein
MNWLLELHRTQPSAHTIGVPAFVCVAALALGTYPLTTLLRIRSAPVLAIVLFR